MILTTVEQGPAARSAQFGPTGPAAGVRSHEVDSAKKLFLRWPLMVDLLLLQHSARIVNGLAGDYYKRVRLLSVSFDHLNYASLPHPARKFFTLSRSILIL